MYIKTLTAVMLSLFALPALAHLSDMHHSHAIEFFALFAVLMFIPMLWRLLKNRLKVRVRKN